SFLCFTACERRPQSAADRCAARAFQPEYDPSLCTFACRSIAASDRTDRRYRHRCRGRAADQRAPNADPAREAVGTGKPAANDDSRGPGLPATHSAKMVRCTGPRIRSPLSEKQIAKLQQHIREAGFDVADVARLCRTFGVETLDQLPATK